MAKRRSMPQEKCVLKRGAPTADGKPAGCAIGKVCPEKGALTADSKLAACIIGKVCPEKGTPTADGKPAARATGKVRPKKGRADSRWQTGGVCHRKSAP